MLASLMEASFAGMTFFSVLSVMGTPDYMVVTMARANKIIV
jgi:hypothetical protein